MRSAFVAKHHFVSNEKDKGGGKTDYAFIQFLRYFLYFIEESVSAKLFEDA